MILLEDYDEIVRDLYAKKFATRGSGVRFSQKIWRTGYNKAIDEVCDYLRDLLGGK